MNVAVSHPGVCDVVVKEGLSHGGEGFMVPCPRLLYISAF